MDTASWTAEYAKLLVERHGWPPEKAAAEAADTVAIFGTDDPPLRVLNGINAAAN